MSCPTISLGNAFISKIILCILLRESEKIRFYLYLRSQDLLEEFIYCPLPMLSGRIIITNLSIE